MQVIRTSDGDNDFSSDEGFVAHPQLGYALRSSHPFPIADEAVSPRFPDVGHLTFYPLSFSGLFHVGSPPLRSPMASNK